MMSHNTIGFILSSHSFQAHKHSTVLKWQGNDKLIWTRGIVYNRSGLNFLKIKSSDTWWKVVNLDQICTSHNHLTVCLQFSLRLHIFIFHNLHEILAHVVRFSPSSIIYLDILNREKYMKYWMIIDDIVNFLSIVKFR